MIGVQSEMDKVSWPTWPQLWRATVVVLVVMVVLAASLFLFDIIWRFVFTKVGFLRM
ncbi:preprotein translocase subunit SecE [bacterium]|nr:preprotein translocase subunit SecE [Planctomyces sp.]MBR9802600.1 preprotein translocase subunit SecE [bacterium]